MSLYGDDCYFYYYSSCNKGTTCPYRHVPEARGIETMCTLWKTGTCTRPACRFRHMEITVDRSNIPCYWETQPTGCIKAHCPFKHYTEKAVFKTDIPEEPVVERSVLPPSNKTVNKTILNKSLERSTPSPTSISSPKIEPVVVNPFSDDSDEGSPLKRQHLLGEKMSTISTTKAKVINFNQNHSKEDSSETLTVKIKTLAEIRREKEMLKIINDSLKCPLEDDTEPYQVVQRPVNPIRRIVMDTPDENTPTQVKPALVTQKVHAQLKPVINQKLPTISSKSVKNQITQIVKQQAEGPSKGNIKSRLGRKVGDSDNDNTTKTSVASRLGLPVSSNSARLDLPVSSNSSKENENENKDVKKEIKIKSLEEIRAAKMNKNLLKKTVDSKKNSTTKKAIRKITLVEEEESVKTTDNKETRFPPATVNKQDNTSPKEKTRKRVLTTNKSVKQDRAIYVPPSAMKQTGENKPCISPPKKSRLSEQDPKKSRLSEQDPKKSRLSEQDDETDSKKTEEKSSKICVKTFAELMAEKRKKKEEDDKKDLEKSKKFPKKSNFTPIVFDIDQKEKMAVPKIVAATLPFRHKKSAFVTPIQNVTEKDNTNIDNSTKNIKTQIVQPVLSQPEQTDTCVKLDNDQLKTDVNDQQKSNNIVNLPIKQTIVPNISVSHQSINDSQSYLSSAKLTKTVKSPEIKNVTATITDQIKSQDKAASHVLEPTTVPQKVVIPATVPQKVVIPASVKRKSISLESNSEKKKLRTSTQSEDDLLFGDDDDDNNFTLSSSHNYNDDEADDILGDIDALLA